MKRNPRRIIVPIVLVLAVIAGVWYFLVRPAGSLAAAWDSLVNPSSSSSGALTASGTVETTIISIAPEAPGKILEVDVQESDVVKAGDVLFHLDDSILKIQRTIAATNLEMAKMALQQLTSPAALAVAQQSVAQDQQNLDNAQASLNNQLYYTTNKDAIQNAQANLTLANNNLSNAQDAYANVGGDPNTDANKAYAYQKLYTAQLAYNSALYNYNWWRGKPNQEQIDLKTALLALAKAKLAEDQTLVAVLSGGSPIPDSATGAGIVQLRQAQFNIQTAQANLDLLDAQIGKMTVKSPVDGVVITRNAEPGSVVNAGAALLTLGRLDELTITVYVPEDRLGEVMVGQTANVTVDSFPGVVFKATVSNISDQAEFTPRNVQTVSGRKNTVFAVKLNLNDTSKKLKPGMPADVTFNPK
jgi:HlyD family secretion protein